MRKISRTAVKVEKAMGFLNSNMSFYNSYKAKGSKFHEFV